MSKTSRSTIVGFHHIKNKVSRNAFDLSHRHMFTAQIGELLPVFVQWVNPNETFTLGYNGFSRTQPLQTAAFTRLKENIQYYFVPFQSLWKYFEQQVNNMTKGQSGENISRIALSPTKDSSVTTGMPYFNLNFLRSMFESHFDALASSLASVYNSLSSDKRNYKDFYSEFLKRTGDIFVVNDVFVYASTAKLLRALGYFNTDFDTYDVISNFLTYAATQTGTIVGSKFLQSQYGILIGSSGEGSYYNLTNSPNLSIFPLLAYQKIINDHYIYRQWQPYKSFACNIDYLNPSDSMDISKKFPSDPKFLDIFHMGYSNLPLDYFNGVLPKAQYGDESAASIVMTSPKISASLEDSSLFVDTAENLTGTTLTSGTVSANTTSGLSVGSQQARLVGSLNDNTVNVSTSQTNASLRISALRSAIALQKYKEIQESNDSDFASQVLAHFGVKPKHDDYKSYFIGGGDSVIDINPQINQNLADGNDPDIKATGTGALKCHCKFHSDTFGIIIGIYRCVPQLDFAHVGIDRNLFKTDASDFPVPELDNIGMQTQYRCEVACPRIGTKWSRITSGSSADMDMSRTYGYLPRYSELKTSYDRYEGAFLDSLSSWVTGYSDSTLLRWLTPRQSGQQLDYRDISELLTCKPSICYPIFLDQSSVCSNNDKILVGSVNTCVAVRPFSVYGLPYSK